MKGSDNMSFVYDTDLLKRLLKIAQADQTSYEQYVDPETRDRISSAAWYVKNVLDNLEKQAAPPETPAEAALEVSYEDDPSDPNKAAPQLTSTNLESLGALVAWAVMNRMTVGGQRIAYGANDTPPGGNYVFYKLEPNSGLLEPADRSVTKQGYFVNKDLLVKFIQSRQAALAKTPNMVEQVQLGMLIDDANRLLGTNISREYKEPETVVPDNARLDSLPQAIDPEQWGAPGDKLLTAGSLKNRDALEAWLKTNSVTMKGDDGKDYTVDDVQNFDICAFVGVLQKRAERISRGSQRPEAKAYVSLVAKLATELRCAGPQQAQPGAPGAAGGAAVQLQQLVALRPFNSNNLNLTEIQLFVDSFAPIANTSTAKGKAAQVKKSIQGAMGMMSVKDPIIKLEQLTSSSDLTPFKALSNTPLPLAEVLYTVVYYSGTLYQEFVNMVTHVLPRVDATPLKQQIEDGGPWSENIDDINELRKSLTEEARSGGR